MKAKAALAAILLVACGSPAVSPKPADTIVRGHVLDENGKPLPLAHIALNGQRMQVGSDGAFSISWTPTQRLTTLGVTGAGHREEHLLIAREEHDVDVTIKLGAPAPRGEVRPIFVLGSRENPKNHLMTREPDGSYAVTIQAPDGRYDYFIGGIMNQGASGVPTDGWSITKDGFYQPQIMIKGGSVRVTFDPRAQHESYSTIELSRSAPTSAALTATALRVGQVSQRLEAKFDELLHAKGGPAPNLMEHYKRAEEDEWSALRRDLVRRAKTASPALVRQHAAVAYFQGEIESPTDDERALANQLLRELQPDDVLWSAPPSLQNVLQLAPNPAYAKAFIAKHADAEAVGRLLFAQLEDATDPAETRALFEELKKPRYADLREHDQVAGYDPDRALAPGKTMSFDVSSVASPPGRLTQQDLAGTVYLVDFWGTWCAPCVAELPRIHDLYAKFGGPPTAGRRKRFEIVSLAAEENVEPILKFRADHSHPMPWKNGFAAPEAIEKLMGPGLGFPSYVLVDETGKIIKSSPQLRASELPDLLEKVLR